VLTDQPLNNLFINKEASSRIAKWATELSEHTIDFGKRAIKSQVLADFVVDWTSPSSITADEELVPIWEIRCDGASGRKGAGIAAIITSPTGIKLRYTARLDYKDPSNICTNNTTEYEALLLGLRKVRALGASNFLVKCDAKVIKDHVERKVRPESRSWSSISRRCARWRGIFGGSPSSNYQEKIMEKPTSSQRKLQGGR
jgi:hypothetical protein